MGSNGGFGRESHWISPKHALNSGLGIRVSCPERMISYDFQIRSFLKPLGFQDTWTFLEISFWGPPILSISFHGRPTVLILLLNRNYFIAFSSISISIRGNGAALPSIKGFLKNAMKQHVSLRSWTGSKWVRGPSFKKWFPRLCGETQPKKRRILGVAHFSRYSSVTSRKIYACFLTPVSWLIGPLEWVVITQLTN